MLVVKNDDYGQSGSFIVLTRNGNYYSVSLYVLNHGADISHGFNDANYTCIAEQSFDVSVVFQPNTIFAIVMDKTGGLCELQDMTAMHTSRDGCAPYHMFFNATEACVLSLYFHEEYTNHLIVTYIPTKTAEQYELRAVQEHFVDLIRIKYPDSMKMFNILKGRRDVLFALDPNDSISYIEAQLDVLNQLVFLMLDALPDVKTQIAGTMPGYSDFRTCFDQHNLMAIKPIDKCLAEIMRIKGKVRQLQTAYYAVKAENE